VLPTAGIRTLCLDGGGVRGVISLMFLEHLQDELSGLGGSIYECFDYICGTSAGKMRTW
jgi:patatin-like phospholipase/acyl hydrolase